MPFNYHLGSIHRRLARTSVLEKFIFFAFAAERVSDQIAQAKGAVKQTCFEQ